MMSIRAWLALLIFYLVYLIIGGFTFRAIESPFDCQKQKMAQNISRQIHHSIQALQRKYSRVSLIFVEIYCFYIRIQH